MVIDSSITTYLDDELGVIPYAHHISRTQGWEGAYLKSRELAEKAGDQRRARRVQIDSLQYLRSVSSAARAAFAKNA